MAKNRVTFSSAHSPAAGELRRPVRPIVFLLVALLLASVVLAFSIYPDALNAAWSDAASYFHRPAESRIHTGTTVLGQLRTSLETFENDNGRYPTTEEGLEALVIRPANVGDNWHKQMDELSLDQWGHAFRYRFPSMRGAESYDLDSAGPDGIFDTTDAIHMESHFQ